MKITIGLILLFIFVAIIAPFSFFPDKMNDYGTFLAGLAAILAVLKYAMPYLLIFKYREDYSNELILKKFFNISIEASEDNNVPEAGYILGVIEYYKRVLNALEYTDNDHWYRYIPYISDELYYNLENTTMSGADKENQFRDIKNHFYQIANTVAINSTPDKPIKEEKKKIICKEFNSFIQKVKKLESMITEVPLPVKLIINANEFYKSFIKS
jgi:hypothetical protein